MPLPIDQQQCWQQLAATADAVIATSCQDRASSNIAFSGRIAQLVDGLEESNAFYDEEWCQLHSTNNLKMSSKDMCRLCSRYFNISSLFKSTSYIEGALHRLDDWIKRNLVRHVRMEPNAQEVATNRSVVDALFDLNAAHHYKKTAEGIVKSNLLGDLDEMLSLDCGSWRKQRIVCYCWDPTVGRPKHTCIEACRGAFLGMYYRFYLGASWPVPSVTKFTNMSIIDKRIQLAFAQHGIVNALIEPFDEQQEHFVPHLLDMGSGMSDFQTIHRARKYSIAEWALRTPDTRWHAAILASLAAVLDKLTYEWFGKNDVRASLCEVLAGSGVVCRAQGALANFLSSWHEDESQHWAILDAVTGSLRSQAPEQIRRFMRRNLAIYACGLFRRFEIALAHTEKPLHQLHCRTCSATDASREEAWSRVLAMRPCCVSFFARRVCRRFSSEDARRGPLSTLLLDMRERLQLRSTKFSEASHAHGQRILSRSLKPLSLSHFARQSFLCKVNAAFIKHGGHQRWHSFSDTELLKALPNDSSRDETLVPCIADGDGEAADNQVALQPRAAGALALPPPQNSGGRHLNPVLRAFNEKQRVAKALGERVDEARRAQLLAEAKAEYKSKDGEQRMKAEYERYLHQPRDSKHEVKTRTATATSTFWGWGSGSTPVPVDYIREYVSQHGLVPSRQVWGEDSCNEFRVTPGGDGVGEWRPQTVRPPACGALPRNECRLPACVLGGAT